MSDEKQQPVGGDMESSSFEEFKDYEFANWKRIRLALEHENTLTNARIGWLLSIQAFLLTAFIFIFVATIKKDFDSDKLTMVQMALYAICTVGTLSCIYISAGIRAAFAQHRYLELWWNEFIKESNERHPNICGKEPKVLCQINYSKMPIIFFVMWIGMASSVNQEYIFNAINRHHESVVFWGGIAIVAMIAVFVGIVIGKSSNNN